MKRSQEQHRILAALELVTLTSPGLWTASVSCQKAKPILWVASKAELWAQETAVHAQASLRNQSENPEIKGVIKKEEVERRYE